jgi:methylmalonyl-CoA mutase, N-terminal domain
VTDVLRRLERTRAGRDARAAERAVRHVVVAAQADENTIPPLIEAARARATLGEICDGLRGVYGRSIAPPVAV